MRTVAVNRRLGWLGFQSREALEHQVGIAGCDGHFDGLCQPDDGMFVSMLSDDVAVGLDLSGTFQSEALLDLSPSQKDDDHVLVHRLVGLDAEVGQAQLGLEVEVDDFARPPPSVSLQGLFGQASVIRTCNVRRGSWARREQGLLGVPEIGQRNGQSSHLCRHDRIQ